MSKRAQISDNDESDSDISFIDVSFDFFSPNPSVDYHAIKRLLTQLFSRDAELFHLHELTELVLSQPNIGTTIKTDGEETDPYALLTVINMHLHHENTSIKAIAQYCLSKASSASSSSSQLHTTLQSLFSQSQNHVGLVICERLINMPVQVIPPMYTMLRDEISNAIRDNLPYKFTHLLFISRTYHLSLEEESALANSMPISQARKKNKKTKKRRNDSSSINDQHGHGQVNGSSNSSKTVGGKGGDGTEGRPDDGIYSFHPEDSVISQLSTHTLNYTYTAPALPLHQETRGKDAFGLDVRGRIMVLDLASARNTNSNEDANVNGVGVGVGVEDENENENEDGNGIAVKKDNIGTGMDVELREPEEDETNLKGWTVLVDRLVETYGVDPKANARCGR